MAEVNLRRRRYDNDQQRTAFDNRVLARLHQLPGVTSAALVSAMPLEGETWIESIVRPDKANNHPPLCNVRWISPEYFTVMRQRLAKGRFLEERDRDLSNAIISESSAKAAWAGEDPVGRQLKWDDRLFTVVGIIADARVNSLKTPPANMLYLPYPSPPPYATFFMARSTGSAETLINQVRRSLWNEDPEVTIARIKTLNAEVNDSLAAERLQTFILIAFGFAALLLAMLGVYGILSYTVAGRTQEIGVRMALGATRRRIYALTLFEAAVPVIGGLCAGLIASLMAAKLIHALLYGVTGTDWSIAITVALLLMVCAAAGAFLPARCAASVDPMQALRSQ